MIYLCYLTSEVNEMSVLITKCPGCRKDMEIAVLRCPECGLELRNRFELSAFDRLNSEGMEFLMAFLKNRGNLKNVQNDLGISYPTARKKLEGLLAALGIVPEEQEPEELEEIDMGNIQVDKNSTKASEIIKRKLVEAGGRVPVRLLKGDLREVAVRPDGKSFSSPVLGAAAYPFEVFDAVVDLLLASPGYRAKKGNARNYKLGEPGCEETTVAGTVLAFMGKKPGESGLDPVYILAAVLEWAGIAVNGRSEIALTAEYRSML